MAETKKKIKIKEVLYSVCSKWLFSYSPFFCLHLLEKLWLSVKVLSKSLQTQWDICLFICWVHGLFPHKPSFTARVQLARAGAYHASAFIRTECECVQEYTSGVSKAIKLANCLSSYLLLIASLPFMTNRSCGGSKDRFRSQQRACPCQVICSSHGKNKIQSVAGYRSQINAQIKSKEDVKRNFLSPASSFYFFCLHLPLSLASHYPSACAPLLHESSFFPFF